MVTPIIVSYSEIDAYRQCPLKWELAWKRRLSDPHRPPGARDRGTLWHQVLEAHYTAIRDAQLEHGYRHTVRWSTAAAERLRSMSQLRGTDGRPLSDDHELVEWMYDGYLKHYGFDPAWEVLAIEVKDEVPIYTPAGRRTRYRLKTKIDLIVRDWELGGKVWVIDHKSGKDLPRRKALDIDDQFGFYTLAMRRQGCPVFGQLYSAARTQRNKTGVQTFESRMERYRLYRDDRELVELERDLLATVSEMYGGRRPYGTRTSPDPDRCGWRCDFLEVHLQARKTGRSPVEVADEFGFVADFTRH